MLADGRRLRGLRIQRSSEERRRKMRRKKIIATIIMAILLIAAPIIICSCNSKQASKEANSLKEAPKETKGIKEIKEVIEYNPPYGKVILTHKKHAETYKIDCLKCHHDWKPGQATGKLCKDCHKAKTEGKAISAKEAFHKNCKGCHDELKKAGKTTGPTGCTQCHKK